VQLVACERCHAQFEVSSVTENKFRCHCGATVWNRAHAPVDAPIQRCASCGAAVPAEATICDYCTSPIVRDRRQLTLICPECFAACAGNARFCGHCGVEFRPQPITGASDLACPVCQTAMTTRSIAEVAVQSCPECQGLWVPGESFDLLVARAQSLPEAPRPSQGLGVARRHAADANQDTGEIVYRRCPACRSPMHRKNFGHASGVIVDWCGPHGTWLDADELERIAAFIRNGGLERAMAAHAADEEKQRKELAAAEAGAPRPPIQSQPTLALFEHLLLTQRKTAGKHTGQLVDLLHEFFKSP